MSSRPGGTTGVPKSRVAIEDFRIDYERFSEILPDEHFPKGSNWLALGPHRTAPPSPRRGTPGPVPGRHRVLPRSGPEVGDRADPEGMERTPRGLQAPCDGSGGHDPRSRPRHPLPVRHPEAPRRALPPARGRGDDARRVRHPRGFLRRHRVHPGVDPVRDGGAPAGRVPPAHLRKHADGARAGAPADSRGRLPHRLLPADAAGGPRGRGPGPRRGRGLRRHRARAAHHAHPGVLHAGLLRTRRGRTRTPVGTLRLGRG